MTTDSHDFDYRDPKRLKPFMNNPKIHTTKQVEEVAASIGEFGFANPVIIDESDNILAGHCRADAAIFRKMKKVPVYILVGLTDAQKMAYVIADNKLAQNSKWDMDLLAVNINELVDDFEIDLLGFSESELEVILKDFKDQPFGYGDDHQPNQEKNDHDDSNVPDEERSITDDRFVMFEAMMAVDNKKTLISTLNEIRKAKGYETNDLALMELVGVWRCTERKNLLK
ncbi:TPA: ParB/Srx family N-terminal domain-containing protein [Vibrio parahaemolyticus]|uniref:ParB/Srx family N-terminal domain-containing protein n=2 Tax=Vibrio parahaemolyticus TaxID=670 RepID=UPI0022B463EE|nr:ParB/Srx family N-terminal domain-containing protein [Vibrio parahaemolyticus]MCZ6278736.1 ParB/Srx family N-terminal domain-containing protein [Vibrio parahaemolyticus]